MSVRFWFLVAAILAASCTQAPADLKNDEERDAREVAATFSPSNPQPLQLTVLTRPLPNGLRVEGRTNLPDGTELMMRLQRGPVMGGDKEYVQNGRFQENIYPKDGQPIPSGTYEVEVSTPAGDLQPPNVKEQLGSDYEALTGPFVKNDEIGIRGVNYTTKVKIGGAVDPYADAEARKAAYRQHVAYSEKACRSNPDAVEHLTGTPMSSAQRANSVRKCLEMMAQSRQELVREGLLQR